MFENNIKYSNKLDYGLYYIIKILKNMVRTGCCGIIRISKFDFYFLTYIFIDETWLLIGLDIINYTGKFYL